jgi:hypothetical protein
MNHSFYRKLIVEGDPCHIGKMKLLKFRQDLRVKNAFNMLKY